jgi:hypothetical protein
MITRNVIPFAPEVLAGKDALEEHRARRQNQHLAQRILLPDDPARIAVNSGHSHLEMGRRLRISENEGQWQILMTCCRLIVSFRPYRGSHRGCSKHWQSPV